ncbi:MAG: GTP-binding protein [Eubacteriales bacterium]|nr:GTP-binding protein [Eubacteriales bacterium]
MKKKDLYVLTGFLGAGKTSLLLHLLNHMPGKKIGVIQNEFGKLSIDGTLVRRDGIEMTEISRGSIFCSCLKLSFVQALAEMGKCDLDLVFVESSGLADPSNIEEILRAAEVLAGDVYRFQGVICLIDGVNFIEQLTDAETVDRQLAHCNLAVINKIDLLDEVKLREVESAVRSINPVCRLTYCKNGEIDLSVLDDTLTDFQWAACEASSNTVDNKPKTLSLECSGVIPKKELTAFLQKVLPYCYRIKGFFHLDDGWQQTDVVEKLIDYKDCEPKEISQLVFLSKIGPQVIRKIDSAWKETIQIPMQLKN